MSAKIFSYCERGLDPSYWAEPLNAVTNAAFLVGSAAALALWRSERGMLAGKAELFLTLVVFAIGIGSFLFHTHAEPWAALADVIPIGIFMVAYLGYALRRYLNWDWINTVVALVGFVFMLGVASMTRCDGGACLNGSLAYFPAFLVMLLIGGVLMLRGHAAGGYVFAAGIVFAVSLTLRSIDRDICGDTIVEGLGAIGTHFGWHILNALLLYLLLRGAILYGPRLAPTTAPKSVDRFA